MISTPQFLLALPNARQVAGVFVCALKQAVVRFRIDSPVRATAFLTQAFRPVTTERVAMASP